MAGWARRAVFFVGVAMLVAAVASAGSGALASGQFSARLVQEACTAPATAVGSGCVDASAELGGAKEWPANAATSAEWDHAGQWMTTYKWTVPSGVPPQGADVTLTVTASELTGNPGASICPALGISGESTFKVTPANAVSVCAQSKQSGISKSATLHITPPQIGGTLTLKIGVQDGPTYTYTYASEPVGSVSVALKYAVVPPGTNLSPGHVAVGTTVHLVATVTGFLPNGAYIEIYDKPQRGSSPATGWLRRTCSTEPCTVNRAETKLARVHAYRAFVTLGLSGSPGFKVLARSNPVIVSWDENAIPVEFGVDTTGAGTFESSATVSVATRVTLRAETKAALPPGTLISIFSVGGGSRNTVRNCFSSPCITLTTSRYALTLSYFAGVYRGVGSKPLGESPPVEVTYGSAWSGTWKTSYGTMHLIESGSHVDGTYASCNGTATITGHVIYNVLTGTWNQPCNSKSGKLRFTLSSDGKSFTGVWGYGTAAPTQPWNGTGS